MGFDWATLIAGILGALVTGAGLVYAGKQIKLAANEHASTEQWRRMEFARGLLERLSTDDELAFCARALDWGLGPLVVPTKHRMLFPIETVVMTHDPELLYRATRPELRIDPSDGRSLTYRYSFDAFFSYLESINYYIDSGNVMPDQLVGLDYYIGLIADPPYLKCHGIKSQDEESPFLPFVRKFYPSLEKLIWPRPV